MWKLDASGERAEYQQPSETTAFVCAAVIINDEYETRIHKICKTLDEAKAELAKLVAEENAEESAEDTL